MDSTDSSSQTLVAYDQLAIKLAEVEAENRELRTRADRVGLAFKDIPEEGDADLIAKGYLPILIKDDLLSLYKPNEKPTNANTILIEGDNISALFALQHTHKGKVNVIYIDPPYNTGNNDFVYEDKRVHKSTAEDLKNTEKTLDGKSRLVGKTDPYRHSKWLSFMRRRLYLARTLLSETGVIFVSIDDNEQARLKLLMDEVFGEENFLNQFVWVNKMEGRSLGSVGASSTKEYILSYGKILAVSPEFTIDFSTISKIMPTVYGNKVSELKQDKIGSYITTHELYNGNSAFNEKTRPNLVYNIYYNSSTGDVKTSSVEELLELQGYKLIKPHLSADKKILYHAYRWSRKKVETETVDLEFIPFHDSYKIMTKRRDIGKVQLKDLIMNLPASAGNREITAIVEKNSFNFPKPVKLIEALLASATDSNSIILDFFAGSGTTGHAVAELNKEDGGTRQCILVTNNENGISENVTAERIKRVLSGKNWADGKTHELLPGELHYYKLSLEKFSHDNYEFFDELDGRYAGIAALQTGAHRVVTDGDEDFTLLLGADSLSLILNDLGLVTYAPEEIMDKIQSVEGKYGENYENKFLYLPWFDDEEQDVLGLPEGWTVKPYPKEYFDTFTATRQRLIGSGMLSITKD